MLCTFLALSLSTLPQDPPAAPTNTLEMIALPDLCRPPPALVPPPWGTMLVHPQERVDLVGAEAAGERLSLEMVAQLMMQLHAKAAEEGRLEVPAVGDTLLVRGDAATVAALRDQLKELTGVLRRPLEIEVAAWAADGPPPASVLGAKDFAAFAANRTPLWRAVAETRSSTPVSFDQQRWTAYVRDIDVEVAENSSVSFPQTSSFGQGNAVLVVPHALPAGDDVVLHVQFAAARQRDLRTVSCGIEDAADVDLPLLETAFGACSARVPNGGALAFSLRGHASGGGQTVWTVRATGRVPPQTSAPSGLGVFPIGALAGASLMQRMRQPSENRDETLVAASDDGGPGFGAFDESMLAELVRSALGAAAETCEIQVAGSHLFCRGDADAVAQTGAFLQALQDRVLRTATVRHTIQLAGTGTNEDPAGGALLHEIQAPTMLGRVASFGRCLETHVIGGLFAEIAKDAAVLQPGIDLLQSGVWVDARVVPTTTGMHLDLRAQCRHGVPPASRSMRPNGVLMLSDVASAHVRHSAVVASGRAVSHGDGPIVEIDGRRSRTAAVTSLQW